MTSTTAYDATTLPLQHGLASAACILIPSQYVTHFLAVSRKDNKQSWGLPGGKVEQGETACDAAIRETYEETGLIITPDQLSFLAADQVLGTDGKDYWVTTFLCQKTPQNIRSMRPEKGIQVAWQEANLLANDSHSPFASYHTLVLDAFEREIVDRRLSRQRCA